MFTASAAYRTALHCTKLCMFNFSFERRLSRSPTVPYPGMSALAGSRTSNLINWYTAPNQGCKHKPLLLWEDEKKKKKDPYFRASLTTDSPARKYTTRPSIACRRRPYKPVVARAGEIHVSFLLLASGPRPSSHTALATLLPVSASRGDREIPSFFHSLRARASAATAAWRQTSLLAGLPPSLAGAASMPYNSAQRPFDGD